MSEEPNIVSFAEKTGKRLFPEIAKDMAQHYRTIFDAFRAEGFSEAQAMDLMLGLYSGAPTEYYEE
jgi:hypothetical protein